LTHQGLCHQTCVPGFARYTAFCRKSAALAEAQELKKN